MDNKKTLKEAETWDDILKAAKKANPKEGWSTSELNNIRFRWIMNNYKVPKVIKDK